MPIKVIPFLPEVSNSNSEIEAAQLFEEILQQYNNDGWEFKSIQTIKIKSTSAFSIKGENKDQVQCIVFEKF